MNILITGAFGNIGQNTVRELVQRNYNVATFDIKTPANLKKAANLGKQVECFWGDLRDPATLEPAVQGRDVIVHLAAIIPPLSERNPDLAQSVNVTGTKTLVDLMTRANPVPRIIFTSSISVFGDTQELPPPRSMKDALCPTDTYSHTKVECEDIIHASGLEAVIFRLAAAPPVNMDKMDSIMFQIRLDTRMEFVHSGDVALAIANAITCDEAWGNTFLIGGGKESQLLYRDFIGGAMNAMGIGTLPDAAFGTKPFYTDWLDTTESQRLLKYQQRPYSAWVKELVDKMGFKIYFIKMLRPFIRLYLLNKSPYWKESKKKKVKSDKHGT